MADFYDVTESHQTTLQPVTFLLMANMAEADEMSVYHSSWGPSFIAKVHHTTVQTFDVEFTNKYFKKRDT